MYDFTTIMDRRGKDALAVDAPGPDPIGMMPAGPKDGFDMIPMWIADMNFATVPTIPEAIIERAKHSLYGYFNPSEEYFDSIIKWQETRNGVTGLTAECIGYENGVLGGVVSTLTAFAGSIGIIGIALILALSTGMQSYIDKVQEDALASYPVTIQKQTVDMTTMMTSMMEAMVDEDGVKHEDGKIYSRDIMNQILIAMTSKIQTNNLAAFKE